jgi:hypothetical protein
MENGARLELIMKMSAKTGPARAAHLFEPCLCATYFRKTCSFFHPNSSIYHMQVGRIFLRGSRSTRFICSTPVSARRLRRLH